MSQNLQIDEIKLRKKINKPFRYKRTICKKLRKIDSDKINDNKEQQKNSDWKHFLK